MALSQRRTRLIQIPLLQGQNDGVDPKVASMFNDQPVIKQAKNLRMRKDGRLGLRNGVTQLGDNTTDSGGLVAYDVCNFNEKLFAMGSNQGDNGPTQLWEYQTGQTGQDWSCPNNFNTVSLGQTTPVTEITQFGGEQDVFSADCAASNDFVCIAYETIEQPNEVWLIFYRASTKTVVHKNLIVNMAKPMVEAVSDTGTFLITGIDVTDNSAPLYRFNPSTDTNITQLTDLFAANANVITALATARVAGTTNLIALVDHGSSTNAVIHRVDTSGSTVGSDINIASVDTQFAAIESNGTNANVILILSGVASLRTYVLGTGSLANGPTTLFGGDLVNGPPSIVRRSSTTLTCAASCTEGDTNETVKLDTVLEATHSIDENDIWYGASLSSRLMTKPTNPLSDRGIYWAASNAWFTGAVTRTNSLNLYTALDVRTMFQQVVLDQQFGELRDFSAPLAGGSVDPVGEKAYWIGFRKSILNSTSGVLYEANLLTTARRQTTTFGGQLFIASGCLQQFDGNSLYEAGFQDIPEIRSIAQSDTISGALTLLGTYSYAIVFRHISATGRVTRSAPSEVLTTTLTGSNDTITLTVNTPHSLRFLGGGIGDEFITVEVYRGLAGSELLRLAGEFSFEGSTSTYGIDVDIVDTASDLSIQTNQFIYTQGDQGAQSGILEHNSPRPCYLVAAGRDLVCIAGQPDRSTFQVSKALFPNESLAWSEDEAFFGTVGDDITGIHFLDERLYVFTKSAIYQAIGDGPTDAGDPESVSLSNPQLVTSTYGLIDASNSSQAWRSLLEDTQSLWFQATNDRIMRMGRGGGEPEWASRNVQDVLAAFPVVCAASFVPDDYLCSWVLQATNGASGRVINRDSRTEQWFTDEYPLVWKSCTDLNRKLVFLATNGRVYQQSTGFSDAGSFISTLLETATMYPGGPGGWGHIVSVQFKGEYRGDCVLTFSISYDDGKTYVPSASMDITAAAGFTVGQTVDKIWYPARRKCEGFRVKFEITEKTGSGPTEALVINELTFEVMTQNGSARRNPSEVV